MKQLLYSGVVRKWSFGYEAFLPGYPVSAVNPDKDVAKEQARHILELLIVENGFVPTCENDYVPNTYFDVEWYMGTLDIARFNL